MDFKELYETRTRQFQLISGWPASARFKKLQMWLNANRDRYEQELKIEKKVTRNVF